MPGPWQESFVRAGAFILVMGSALLTATVTASGATVIDMPAARVHPAGVVAAGDSRKPDLGAVALHRYAAARRAPLYSYVSVPLYRPYYGYGFGLGYGYGYACGFGYPFGFGLGHHFGFGHRRH